MFDPTRSPSDQAFGAVLAADVRGADGHDALKKGTRLGPQHRAALGSVSGMLHLIDLDDDELEQDVVASRLAAAIAGPGTRAEGASQGQARVRATIRGLARVRAEAIVAINARHPLLVFTVRDGKAVAEGTDVAGAKSASLATPRALVAEAEAIAAAAPVVTISPFVARSVGVVVTDRLEPRGRALVHDAIEKKIRWFGSRLIAFSDVAHDPVAIADALRACRADGADLVLLSGVSPLDPLDPGILALERDGGGIVRSGVPAHPGSMVWVGALPAFPVLGVASCAGFGKDTALDLLLARVLAGERPADAADALGVAGLADGSAADSPFPPYAPK
ncbi:MAG TPA: hypothetical protein VI814_04520 [Candidatus Limnocylindria bacterium]